MPGIKDGSTIPNNGVCVNLKFSLDNYIWL